MGVLIGVCLGAAVGVGIVAGQQHGVLLGLVGGVATLGAFALVATTTAKLADKWDKRKTTTIQARLEKESKK